MINIRPDIMNKSLKVAFLCLMIAMNIPAILCAGYETVRFEPVNIGHGSPVKVIQDNQGFMWFGSWDGLFRYDGYDIREYKLDVSKPDSFSKIYISSLCEDKNGNIWIGSYKRGVIKLDRDRETTEHFRNDPENPNTLSNNNVNALFEDRDGIIWIGTNSGLNKYDKERDKFEVYINDPDNPNSLSHNIVSSICEDQNGNLWIGTLGGGLCKFNQDRQIFTNFRNNPVKPYSLGSDYVTAIYQDRTENLWIGTNKGLNKFDQSTGNFTCYIHNPDKASGLSHNEVTCIFEESKGNLWIGTANGLNRFDKNTETFILYKNNRNDPNSLSNNIIKSVYEDKSGILWIGTDKGTDKLIRITSFSYYCKESDVFENLTSNIVRAVHEDSEGVLWIGTDQGLNSFNRKEKSIIRYTRDPALDVIDNPGDSLIKDNSAEIQSLYESRKEHSLSGNDIQAIYEDKQGMLWIGTIGGGLNKFDRLNRTFKHYKNNKDSHSLSHDDILAICEDREGVLWIGTDGGLSKLNEDKNSFTQYKNDPGNSNSLSDNTVSAVYEDADNMLWIGTNGGLNKFDPGKEIFTQYVHNPENPDSISHNIITSICEDQSNVLWIGTLGGGLNRFNKTTGTFTHFTKKNGLASDVIYGVLKDQETNLWLSTDKGLSKFELKNETFRNYNENHGLPVITFRYGTFSKSESNEFFLGGTNGFASFRPSTVCHNTHIPPIVLTNFKIFDKPILNVKDIRLSHNENYFSFEFAALDYTAPEKNKYAYMMKGFNHDWIYSDKRYVNYTNLNPGEYIFRAKGSNNDDLWNETGLAIKLTIMPPWWKTWWAKLIFFIGIIAVPITIAYYEKKRAVDAEKMNKLLEYANHKIAEAQESLTRSLFAADFMHRMNNFAGTILIWLELIQNEMEKQELKPLNITEYLLNIKDDVNIMLRANEKLKNTHPKRNIDVSALLEAVLREFRIQYYPAIKCGNLKIEKKIDSELYDVFGIELSLANALSSIISNGIEAILDKGRPGTLTVMAKNQRQTEVVRIDIIDTGTGISKDIIEKIYIPYFTTKEKGRGYGLWSAKLTIDIFKGSIKIAETIKGSGTTFRIDLPKTSRES